MNTKKLVYSAIFIAFGILFPMIFHMFNLSGEVFLPMHTPVFLCSFVLGPAYGLLVGVITPILSSILTGMPPMVPMVPVMVCELGVYGFLAGYLYSNYGKNIYISLFSSIIIGRLVAGVVAFIVSRLFAIENLTFLGFIMHSFIIGIPGIFMTVILVPVIYNWLPDKIKIARFDK